MCLCVGRATSPSRRATLSPRAAPHGWWIPRSQSEPSAPSMRPPFSEWTFPLPPSSHPTPHDPWASPCLTHLPSSPLWCAFHCDTLGRTPPALHLFLLSHRLRFQLKTTQPSRLWLNTFQKYILTQPLNFPTSFCLHLFSSWFTLYASRTLCTVLSLSPSPPTIDSR